VARRALAFGMKIVYFSRNRISQELETVYQTHRLELDELLKTADVVSLHTPLNDETFHLINRNSLQQMKPTAILVNTARGPIVDESALVEALQNHWINAAALDVYENEPNIKSALLELDNVILSPHNGTATVDARNEMSRFASQNIIRFFAGRTDITRVN